MVKNVRWLYAKLGNEDFSTTGQSTVTGALSSLQSELDGKSNESHTHSVDSLPVSNNQVNSTSYIPTSALLYSMSMRAEGIETVVNAAKNELNGPNKRYESKNLGTWSSTSQVDTFLSTYTHENNYEGLSLGNYFTIQDGGYNVEWEIAGFDMECNQMAADGTIYDNGYGICMIPKTYVTTSKWNNVSSAGGYYSSSIRSGFTAIVNMIKYVLGDHVVNRNVLLGSRTGSTSYSNTYTWTTSYAELMSVGQMTGTFAQHTNKYDDGEANYKLPLFDHENYYTSINFWTRCTGQSDTAYCVLTTGNINAYRVNLTSDYGVRPLIYIR